MGEAEPRGSRTDGVSQLRTKTLRAARLTTSCRSIQPARHREQMARDLNDPSIMRWWLPHDEGFTPLLRKVREFADERNDVARTAQQQDVREAKFLYELFAQMEIAGE